MNLLNKFFNKYFKSKKQKKVYRYLNENIYNQFKEKKEGLFLVFLESKQNNIIARAIKFFSGKYSHIVLVNYNEKLLETLKTYQLYHIISKLDNYYKDYNNKILEDIKCLVLSSMDADGSNYFNFSNYNKRKFDIIKINWITKDQEQQIIDKFLSKEIMNSIYDNTGLIFWPLKIFDDERAYYCSEIYQEIFNKFNIKICDKKEASPTDIYYYLIRRKLK